jgi:hypothetical protein
MDLTYVKSLVQTILNKAFTAENRRNIISYDNRINFCCPVCGDSARSAAKKRGNLFLDKLFFKCFNCGFNSSLNKLCNQFKIQIDPAKKMEMIEYLSQVVSNSDYKSDMSDINIDELLNLSDLEMLFNSGESILSEFKPLIRGSLVYNYLLERGITESMHKNIYQAKNWLNEDRYEWVMVLLNRKDDKILGIQTRNLKSGKFRSFKIYNFETLYKWINKINEEEIEGVDLNQLLIYNKLSYFFNILNIDFESTITVFEGYLDSLFYPNSVGVVGVNTNMSLLENNNLDVQYFFDNDEAGFLKSEEKIKAGWKIFLWKKLFEEIVDKKKATDPYSLMYRISQVKDLNKLACLVQNPYQKLELDKFFSQDVYDLKWIPKKQKTYKKWI